MDKQARQFLGTWLLTGFVFAALATVFSALMDPYLLFGATRLAGVNARKPAVGAQDRLVKAYDVLRVAPTALVLGSSRVAAGFDTRASEQFLGNIPVYNLGLGAGSPYMAYRYLQHVSSRRSLDVLMLGLDFEYFLKEAEANRSGELEEFESYLAVTRQGRANADRRWRYTLSLDVLTDSAATLTANLRNASVWDFTSAGNRDFAALRNTFARTGSYPRAAWIDVVFLRAYTDKRKRLDALVMRDVQAILELCESQGTEVILFINPVHADMLEIVDLAGYWPAFEHWKRELMALAATYTTTDSRSRISLWDFSGYHSYATESVAGERLLRWFWEPSHFTPELGDLMLRRMFGRGDASFGVLLTPELLEPHLAAIREQQRLYRKHHAADVQRVRELYDVVISSER